LILSHGLSQQPSPTDTTTAVATHIANVKELKSSWW